MRLNAWRKELNRARGTELENIDSDLMKALSEIPPMRLACIDEAFVLLDSGLGAIFSAGMARRAAMQRSVTKSLATARMMPKLLSLTPEEACKEHAIRNFRRATMRIVAPIRRQAAQRATLKMIDNLCGPHTLDKEAHRDSGKPALPRKRRSRQNTLDKKLDPLIFMTEPSPVVTINFASEDDVKEIAEEVSGIPPSCQLAEDPSFRHWARDKLQMTPDRLEGLEQSNEFREKMGHQMLCWQALHVNKLAAKSRGSSVSPAPLGMDSTCDELEDMRSATDSMTEPSSSCFASVFSSPQSSNPACGGSSASTGVSIKEASAEFQKAEQSLFGLTRYLDAQMMRRSRTPVKDRRVAESYGLAWPASTESTRKGGVSPMPPQERPGQVSSAAGHSHGHGHTHGHTHSHGHGRESNAWALALGKWHRQSAAPLEAAWSAYWPGADIEPVAEQPSSRDSNRNRRLPSRGQTCEPPLGVALRRPPAFVEPHRDIPSTLVAHTPELLYLRRCEVQGLIPCPAVWCKFGDSKCSIIDAAKRGLSDADVCAIVETAVECAAEGHELHKLNLSHNAMTDSGVQRLARIIAAPPTLCSTLTSLSFAGNASLKLRSQGLLTDLAKLLTNLSCLSELDLSGVPVHGHAASILCQALQKSNSLKSLSLAGCELGRLDQTECTAVAALLGCSEDEDLGTFGLERFDLSANFFGRTGFTAAAQALRRSRLQSLSFAGNSAGVSAHVGKDHVQFHPIQLLIEGLQFNRTLETLDLSDCSLGPDSAFVLEDALNSHSTLTSLNLSDNPLGDAGLRSVIRLILALGTDIHICNVCGHREADVSAHTVKFRHTQAGGGYRVNLKFPHERATLRTLLRISEKATSSSFRYFKFDAKQAKPNIEKDPQTERWMLPTHGVYSFTFQPPLSETAQQYSLYSRSVGSGVTPTTIASQAAAAASAASMLAAQVSSAQVSAKGVKFETPKARPLPAMCTAGSMLDPQHAHRASSQLGRHGSFSGSAQPSRCSSAAGMNDSFEIDWTEITGLLEKSRILVSALRYPLLRGMFLSLITREQQSRFILACSKDMAFNGPQVSQLCEDRPELAHQIIGALFPSICGRTAQLLLLSNVALNFSTTVCEEVSPCLWFQEGNLTGRYHLDLERPADFAVAENCLLVNAWESEVGRLMGRPDISQRGNYEMLRNESHNEVPFTFNREWSLPSHGWLRFDYSSIRRPPPRLNAMPEAGEVTRMLQKSEASANSKLRALRAVSVHMFLNAQQFRGLLYCFPPGACRQDFFCLLHTRVVDRQRLLSPESLYASTTFSPEDRAELFHRVGHLHLLNPLHPEGMIFKCNLAHYEERKVIDYLVQLRSKEPGGKVVGHHFDRPHDDERHGPVPASWADKGVPVEPIEIVCGYETTHPNPMWRQALAEKYCVGQFV